MGGNSCSSDLDLAGIIEGAGRASAGLVAAGLGCGGTLWLVIVIGLDDSTATGLAGLVSGIAT